MDEIRLIVLGVGVLVIVLIYLWGMRKQIREQIKKRSQLRTRVQPESEPVLEDAAQRTADANRAPDFADSRYADAAAERAEAPAAVAPPLADAVAPPRPAADPEVMTAVLTVIAARSEVFRGRDLLGAFQGLNLQLNRQGTWDWYADAATKPVFGIGHLREPGVFDMNTIDQLTTPGLILFMRLPGPLDATTAVDMMIGMAGQLAKRLNGMVCDERRNKITPPYLSSIRSEAAEFDRRRR